MKAQQESGHTGQVMLVASPFADSTPYRRSVILVVEHDEKGTVGVVLDGTFQRSIEQLREELPRLVGKTDQSTLASVPVRIASWPPGALEIEVHNGLWMTAPATSEAVFEKSADWADLVRSLGRGVLSDALAIGHFPSDPRVN